MLLCGHGIVVTLASAHVVQTLCNADTAGVSRGGGAYFEFSSNDDTVDTNVTLVDCRFSYNKAGKR